MRLLPNMSILHLVRKALQEYTVLPRQVFLHCVPWQDNLHSVTLYRHKVVMFGVTLQWKKPPI